jgi:hypothetical protein
MSVSKTDALPLGDIPDSKFKCDLKGNDYV